MNILITGITGTIGTAFTEYLLSLGHRIYGIDHNEEKVAAFKKKYDIKVALGEFKDTNLETIDLVIHLAALKHIDLCEQNSNSCVRTNVIDTHALFSECHRKRVDILFMSTDKAVEPTSMYGFSKALGEGMAREYGGAYARSGNVIASNGSVLRIWDEAIEKKEPLTITHKDMKRFFIMADNLVKRIWKAYLKGDKEIIPEMDMNIRLLDLAEIKLDEHGYNLDDYPGGIKYIGLRDGEKLEEKLVW